MFDIQSLQANSETPTFVSILLAVSLCIVLSSCVVLTYDVTTKASKKDNNYLQSLAIISILATMVMQAVGDSLARGLGMLGALAIIRFRTTLRDPRNMTFMFATLAIGISCGVYGFTIAITGTLAFCVMAFILHFSSFGKSNPLIGHLKISIYEEDTDKENVEKVLKQHCRDFEIQSMKSRDKQIVLETEFNEFGKKIVTQSIQKRVRDLSYEVIPRDINQDGLILDNLSRIEGVAEVSLRFQNADDKERL